MRATLALNGLNISQQVHSQMRDRLRYVSELAVYNKIAKQNVAKKLTTSKTILTHFIARVSFYALYVPCFQGVQKEPSGMKWDKDHQRNMKD